MREPYLEVDRFEGVWAVEPVPGGGSVRERLGTLAEVNADPSLIPGRFTVADVSDVAMPALYAGMTQAFNAGNKGVAREIAAAILRNLNSRPGRYRDLPGGLSALPVVAEVKRQTSGEPPKRRRRGFPLPTVTLEERLSARERREEAEFQKKVRAVARQMKKEGGGE